jgi:hypothetical protein
VALAHASPGWGRAFLMAKLAKFWRSRPCISARQCFALQQSPYFLRRKTKTFRVADEIAGAKKFALKN